MRAVEAYFLYWGSFSLKPVDVVSTRLVERSGLQKTSEQQGSHKQNMQKNCMMAAVRVAVVEEMGAPSVTTICSISSASAPYAEPHRRHT